MHVKHPGWNHFDLSVRDRIMFFRVSANAVIPCKRYIYHKPIYAELTHLPNLFGEVHFPTKGVSG